MAKKQLYPCVIREENQVYYAEFPDVKEAYADGESYQEVLKKAKNVLNGTLESYAKDNKEIPEPNMDYSGKQDEIVVYIFSK